MSWTYAIVSLALGSCAILSPGSVSSLSPPPTPLSRARLLLPLSLPLSLGWLLSGFVCPRSNCTPVATPTLLWRATAPPASSYSFSTVWLILLPIFPPSSPCYSLFAHTNTQEGEGLSLHMNAHEGLGNVGTELFDHCLQRACNKEFADSFSNAHVSQVLEACRMAGCTGDARLEGLFQVVSARVKAVPELAAGAGSIDAGRTGEKEEGGRACGGVGRYFTSA